MRKEIILVAMLIGLPIVFANEVNITSTVLEKPTLPTGYVVLVKSLGPFAIGAGALILSLSLLFDLKLDLRNIVNVFISLAVLFILVSIFASLL